MPARLPKLKLLITGGAGFIGSALIRKLLLDSDCSVLNIDKLTYAAVPGALLGLEKHPRYRFVRQDICELAALKTLFSEFKPDAVMNLAAESHVDNSITGPGIFIQTNINNNFS